MPETTARPLLAVASLAALGSTLGWVFFIVGSTGLPDLPRLTDPAARLGAWQANAKPYLVYGWGGVVGALLTIPYLFAIVATLARGLSALWIAFAFGCIGAVMTAVSFMGATLAPIYFVLPHAHQAPDLAQAQVIALEVANATLEPIWFLGSFLAYGIAPGWVAFAAFRQQETPRWLDAVGLAGGVAGLIWLRPFVPALLPFTTIGSAINILLLSTWAVGVTFFLWRRAA